MFIAPRSAALCGRHPKQQLEMFPEDIRIERVDPDANMYRFYRLRPMPDLFGGMSLLHKGAGSAARGGTGSSCSRMQDAQPMRWLHSTGRSRSVGIT